MPYQAQNSGKGKAKVVLGDSARLVAISQITIKFVKIYATVQ